MIRINKSMPLGLQDILIIFVFFISITSYGQNSKGSYPDNVGDATCFVGVTKTNFEMKTSIKRPDILLHNYTTPVVGDLDGDEKPEILALGHTTKVEEKDNDRYAQNVYIFWGEDSHNRVTKIKTPRISARNISGIGIVKTSIEEELESKCIIVILAVDGYLYAYDPDKSGSEYTEESYIWRSSNNILGKNVGLNDPLENLAAVGFADFNNDGIPEIYVGKCIFNASNGKMLACIPENENYGKSSCEMLTAAADMNGHLEEYENGNLELIAGSTIYNVDLDEPDIGKRITIWKKSSISDGVTMIADMDRDGKLDVIFRQKSSTSATQCNIVVWNHTKETKSSITILDTNQHYTYNSVPFIGNVDDGMDLEILMTSRNKLHLFKYQEEEIKLESSINIQDVSGSTGIVLFDFNQDGKAELVYRDETYLYILNVIKEEGSYELKEQHKINCYSGTIFESPVVADINNDGHAEVVVIGATVKDDKKWFVFGNLHILESAIENAWAPARPVWNQYAYYSVNVNSDLSIPKFQFNHATKFPGRDGVLGTADDIQPFNCFMQQQTILNIDGEQLFTTPRYDLITWVFDEDLENNRARIWFCIENNGSSTGTGPLHISLYKNTLDESGFLHSTTTYLLPSPGKSLCYYSDWINDFGTNKNNGDTFYLSANNKPNEPPIKTCKGGTQTGGYGLKNIDFTAKSKDATCFWSNGSIEITPSKGSSPYKYSIDNGTTWSDSNQFNNLPPAEYKVRVKDAIGLQNQQSIIINSNYLSYHLTSKDINCEGNTGSISIVQTKGGIPPYEFSIDGGTTWSNTSNFNELIPNTYSVIVKDQEQCMIDTVVKVFNMNDINISLILDNSDELCTAKGGRIIMNVSGGEKPYQYSMDLLTWQNENKFEGLAYGDYNLYVKDNNNCIQTVSTQIGSNTGKGFAYSDGPLCYGIAQHQISNCLYLGNLRLSKIQTAPFPHETATTAQNDDGLNGGIVPEINGYTDLTHPDFFLDADGKLQVQVDATNKSSIPANALAWIDFNQNGKFDSNESCTLVSGIQGTKKISLEWDKANLSLLEGTTYLRVRLSTSTINPEDAVTSLNDGEVEDYRLNIKYLNFTKTAANSKNETILNIADTIHYELKVSNLVKCNLVLNIFDPLPDNTIFVENSANLGGVLKEKLLNSVNTKLVEWPTLSLAEGEEIKLTFKAIVVGYSDSSTITNIAFTVHSNDTLSSATKCNLAKINVSKLFAGNDCVLVQIKDSCRVDVRVNDTDPQGNYRGIGKIETVIMKQPTLGDIGVNENGTLKFVSGGINGLDSLTYRIQLGTVKAKATLKIAVIEPLKPLELCGNGTIFLKEIEGVQFLWFKKKEDISPFHKGNSLDVNIGMSDTLFYLRADIGACRTEAIKLNVKRILVPVYPDIRVQICKTPSRLINLASYLDTAHFISVNWKKINGPTLTSNHLNTDHLTVNNTYSYKYTVKNKCDEAGAKFYIKTNVIPSNRRIAICYNNAENIHLKQVLGVDANMNSENWDYSHNPLVQDYIKVAKEGLVKGAITLNGKKAYEDEVGEPITYNGDTLAKKIIIIYNSHNESCMGGIPIRLELILTSKIL